MSSHVKLPGENRANFQASNHHIAAFSTLSMNLSWWIWSSSRAFTKKSSKDFPNGQSCLRSSIVWDPYLEPSEILSSFFGALEHCLENGENAPQQRLKENIDNMGTQNVQQVLRILRGHKRHKEPPKWLMAFWARGSNRTNFVQVFVSDQIPTHPFKAVLQSKKIHHESCVQVFVPMQLYSYCSQANSHCNSHGNTRAPRLLRCWQLPFELSHQLVWWHHSGLVDLLLSWGFLGHFSQRSTNNKNEDDPPSLI